MAKGRRKPRPRWYWWDNDNCWWCKNRKGCSGCKALKRYIKEYEKKERKKNGATSEARWLGMIVRMCDRCGTCITPDVCNKQEIYLYKHVHEVSAGQDILKTVTIDLCEQCYNELKNWISKKKTHDDVVIDKDGSQSIWANFEKVRKFGIKE